MLAAFQTYGIQPGPLLFDREPELVWGLIASLFIGNALLLVLNLPLAPFWAKLLSIPRPYLYAGILFFASLGAYAVNAQPFDLVLLLVLGALGFAMRRFGLPVLPAIIGVILGPRAELQLRRALQISDGEVSGLFTSPLAIGIYVPDRAHPALAADQPVRRAAVPQARRTRCTTGTPTRWSNWPRSWPPTPSTCPRTRASWPAPSARPKPTTPKPKPKPTTRIPDRAAPTPRRDDPDGSDRNAPDQHSSPDRKAKT